MSARQLSIIEAGACLDAAKAVAEQQVDAILTALFEAGVTDLAAMSRETLDGVIAGMTDD